MTDEAYLRDLESAAGAVGGIPDDYAQLRSLLAALPTGTAPDIRSGRTAAIATTGGGPGSALTLQSNVAIGSESGSGQGITAPIFYGPSNLLANPTLEGFSTGPSLTAVLQTVGPGYLEQPNLRAYKGRYSVVSGAAPAGGGFGLLYDRGISTDNPFNSNLAQISLTPGVGAGTVDLLLEQGFTDDIGQDFPFLVAACRVTRYGDVLDPAVTALTATMEIVDVTAGLTYAGTPFDVMTIDGTTLAVQISASAPVTPFHQWTWRMRIRVTSSSAWGASDNVLFFGEPLLHWSSVQSPSPYTPLVAGFTAEAVAADARAGESWPRIALNTQGLILGGGAGFDVRLMRNLGVPGNLWIDSYNSAAPTYVFVRGTAGQRAALTVSLMADVASRTALYGDATAQSLEFGPGNAARDVRLFRSSSKVLTIDDTLGGPVQVNIDNKLAVGDGTAAAWLNINISRPWQFGEEGVAQTLSFRPTVTDKHFAIISQDLGTSYMDVFNRNGAAGGVDFPQGYLTKAGVAVSLAGHGAADHVDIVRSFFLPAREAGVDGTSTLINVGASPSLSLAVNYPDAATSGAFWTFTVPADLSGPALTIQPLWTPAATDATAHTVRWQLSTKVLATGSDVTAAGTTTAFTGVSAARTLNILVTDTAQATVACALNDRIRLSLQRLGADALDTYVGAVRLLGIFVTYTANQ
jgi:hypothetical protein